MGMVVGGIEDFSVSKSVMLHGLSRLDGAHASVELWIWPDLCHNLQIPSRNLEAGMRNSHNTQRARVGRYEESTGTLLCSAD